MMRIIKWLLPFLLVPSVLLAGASSYPSAIWNNITVMGTATFANIVSTASQVARTVYAAPNGSSGAPTFRQLQFTDLAGAAVAAQLPIGTSGATVPLLNGTNAWSGPQTFNSRITQSGNFVWSGPGATPSSALSPMFSAQNWSGGPTDNGAPDLNYFRITDTTQGLNNFGWRFWQDIGNGMGGHSPLHVTASNDAFTSFTPALWVTGTPYVTGNRVMVGYNIMHATSAGTSGAVTPTCSGSVNTCSDGTVAWKFDFQQANSQTLVGATVIANPTVSWGGTSGNPIGQTYGFNIVTTCQYDWQLFCIGEEIDFGIVSGNHGETRVGQQLAIEPGGAAASVEDVGWRIVNQGGGAGLANLMTWGSQTSDTVISTAGYGLRAYATGGGNGTPVLMAGAGAIDMMEFNPQATGPFGAGFILRGPGSQIRGNGDVWSGFASLVKTSTGSTLDIPLYQVTAVAVTGGSSGTNWTCTNKFADGADGSVVQVTTISGGAVTGITLIKGAQSTTNTSPIIYTSENPRNCGAISTTGSPGVPSTFSVDTTWSQSNSGAPTLVLGGTANVAVTGTKTNDAAAAGQVGEDVQSVIASGSAVSATTATALNMTSISLTAGDWDVDCNVATVTGGTTVVATLLAGINTTTATLPTAGLYSIVYPPTTAGIAPTVMSPRERLSLSTTTTVFCVAKAIFSTSTLTVYGIMEARRVR